MIFIKDAYLGSKSIFLKKAKKGLSEKAEHSLFMGKGMGVTLFAIPPRLSKHHHNQ